jgi:putative membrane protein
MKRALAWMVVSVLPVLALAADSNPDASFFKNAAEAGMAEVNDATLAEQKGTSQSVKDFAAMMVQDHTAANQKLMSLAASKNIKLPASPSIMQSAEHKKLDVLSGDTFDKSYIKGQIKAHREAVALLKNEIATGQDADVKDFAMSNLPTFRAHLKKINQIATDAGISK